MREGFGTAAGTRRFAARFSAPSSAGNYRSMVPQHAEALALSSIGLGTYLGEVSEPADDAYCAAILAAIRGGINFIDTAINYRHQRSERCVGKVLAYLIERGEISRDEVIVCTKAGYLSFDGVVPQDSKAYFVQEYVHPGVIDPKEVAAGAHCISPRFLKDQLGRSRRNLGLECIDVFYLHNPETQLSEISPERFQSRLRAAFELLEEQVAAGHIRCYGMATWNAFRVAPDEPSYISLEACVDAARSISRSHHFRVIQLPFNLAMTEAAAAAHQAVAGEWLSAVEAARRLSISVVGSSTLMQGRLAHDLPQHLREAIGMATDAGNAIQFARSAPGIVSALVGMSDAAHVKESLDAARTPPMDPERWNALFVHTDTTKARNPGPERKI